MNQEMQPKVTDAQPVNDEVVMEVMAAFDEAATETMAETEPDIELTDEEERQAQEIAVEKASAWMKDHPTYTLDQLSAAKARFLETARASFRKARAENTDTNGNH